MPVNRNKSLRLDNIHYALFDEFLANVRSGERYLTNEKFQMQEIVSTYQRFTDKPIRFLLAGNPYTVYSPILMDCKVDSSKLKPGAFLVGLDYTVSCFVCPPELKAKILASNPQYQFDDSYRRYAFDGESLDRNIRICKFEPKGFKLKCVFKFDNRYISVHKGRAADAEGPFSWWVCTHDEKWLSKMGKRKIVVFNFADMASNTCMMTSADRQALAPLRDAMMKREVAFNCTDAQYMLEDVYGAL